MGQGAQRMSFPFLFQLALYGLTLDALAALYLTDIVTGPALVSVAATMVASWWVDRLHPFIPNYRRLWDLITIAFLVYAVLDLTLLAKSFMAAVAHLLLFLLIYKLYNARNHRDLLDIFLLTFLMLVSSCLFTTSLGFLMVFCLYMILGVWGFILFHLRREADLSMPERSRAALATPGLITSTFLCSSLGMVLTALILTLAIFFLIPRLGRTFLPLRGQASALSTGFTDHVELGIYGVIQNDPTIVMRVSFPDEVVAPVRHPDLRWRGMAFDHFDGRTWTLGDRERAPLRRVRDGYYSLASPHVLGAPFLSYEVVLEPTGTERLFGLPRVTAILGRLPDVTEDGGNGLALPTPPTGPIRYLAISQPERAQEAWLQRSIRAADYPQKIRETYLQLPVISPRVRALALELAAGTERPLEIAKRVERYLSDNLRYDLDLGKDASADPVDDFLFTRKTGNCEYFAAAMAILLRAGGVPARVVNGFQRGEWNDVGQYFAVRQRDAHSWVEVFMPGAGWVTFDPSPRAAFEARAFSASGRLAQHLDALRMRWHRYVVDYDVGDQALIATKLRSQSAALRGRLTMLWESWSFRVRRNLRGLWRDHGYAALLLAALLAALWVVGRRTRPVEMAAAWVLRGRVRQVVVLYDRMLRVLARRGCPQAPGVTAREFLASLSSRPQIHGPAAELTALYERVRFGEQVLTFADRARANALLKQLESTPR
jgi:transglutaminase-like putative cysteine protease